MKTAVAIYLGAGLMAAWAILRAWDHLARREPPTRCKHLWSDSDRIFGTDDPWVLASRCRRCGVARDAPRHLDPEIVVQPWDVRTVTLADGRGTFSRN